MVNKILHSITNRAGGFMEVAFPDSAVFRPSAETQDSRQLRTLLGLDRKSDDYHLIAVLAAIEAYPEIFYAFEDTERTYRIENFTLPTPVVSGGTLVSDHLGVAQIKPVTTDVPVPDAMTLSYLGNTTGVIVYGTRRDVVRLTVSRGQVFPEWPADLGMSGGFTVTWNSSAVISIRTKPVRFPYAVLADRLRQDNAKNGFLMRHDLVEAFHFAEDPVKQVAIAALALGKSNPAVYA